MLCVFCVFPYLSLENEAAVVCASETVPHGKERKETAGCLHSFSKLSFRTMFKSVFFHGFYLVIFLLCTRRKQLDRNCSVLQRTNNRYFALIF